MELAVIQFFNQRAVTKEFNRDQKFSYRNIKNDAIALEEFAIINLIHVFSQDTVTNTLFIEATKRAITARKIGTAQRSSYYLCVIIKDILKCVQIFGNRALDTQVCNHRCKLIIAMEILNRGNDLSGGQCIERILQIRYIVSLIISLDTCDQRILRATGNTVCSKNAEDNSKLIILRKIDNKACRSRPIQRNIFAGGAEGGIQIDRNIQIGSITQNAQRISQSFLVFLRTGELDHQLSVFQITGNHTGGEIVPLLNMLKSNRPRAGYHIISNDGLIIADCIFQLLQIRQIAHQRLCQGGQRVRIEHIRDAVSQRCQSVLTRVYTNKIAQRNVKYLAAVNFELVGRISVEQHIKCQFNQHCFSRRSFVHIKEEHSGIELNDQIALCILLETVEVVGDDAVYLLITTIQEPGNICVIFAAGDHDVTRKRTGHTTHVIHTKRAVNDSQITLSGNITIHSMAIEIEDRSLIKGKIAYNIAHQDDNGNTGQIIKLCSQIGRQAHLVNRVISLNINVQRFICVSQIGQRCSGRHRNAGFILFDHSCQFAKSVNGAKQFFNRNCTGHFARSFIIGNVCRLILLADFCVQSIIFGQIHIEIKHLHRVGQGVDRSIATENRINIIFNKSNRDLGIIGIDIFDIYIAGDQQCGQVSLVCLLRHRQVQIHLTIRHGEVQVVIHLHIKQISCLQHFDRYRAHSNMEGNLHSVRSSITQFHGRRNQFTAQTFHLLIGNNIAGDLHVVDVALGIHHVQQRIRTKAAVHDRIDHSLQRDLKTALFI